MPRQPELAGRIEPCAVRGRPHDLSADGRPRLELAARTTPVVAQLIPVGDTVTAGERRMLEHLRANLSSEWIVLGNPRVHSGKFSREVDAIAIGPRRVWVIDDKGFSGVIRGDTYRWVFEDGTVRTKVVDSIQHAGSMASGVLARLGAPFTNIWIAPVVTLSLDDVELLVEDDRIADIVVRLSDSIPFLTGGEGKKPILDAEQRSTLAEAFAGAAIGARVRGRLETIGRYRLTERISSGDISTTFVAQRQGTADVVELKLYDLTQRSPDLPSALRQTRAEQEYRAVYELRDVPGVLHMADSFQPVEGYGGELYYFALDLPGGPTLASKVDDPDWPFANRLRAARQLVATLEEIHRSPVVHRALTPDVVWFWGSDFQFKVGGFQFARLPGHTLGLSADQISTDGYTAPEVAAEPASATKRSDLYSLAAICWEILTGTRPFGDRPRELDAPMPAVPVGLSETPQLGPVRDELDRLLATQPDARPAAASGLASALDMALAAVAESGERPAATSHPLPAGAQLGEFRVRQFLGSGGAFHAYLVENDEGTRQWVARVARHPERLHDALMEFGVLTQLEHSAIVRPIAVNTAVDAAYHMLQEYSGPITLRDLLVNGPAPPKVIAQIGSAIAGALDYLETRAKPIFHGDITPTNIALGESGPKLIDFGLTYLLDPEHDPGAVVGTMPYRPPERDAPGVPWPSSGDIYSLGVVLGELLFGELPYNTTGGQFDKRSLNEELFAHGHGSFELRAAVRTAVEPDAKNRFRTAADLVAVLNGTPELADDRPPRLERGHVPLLDSLLSLESRGSFNAENRGLDSAFSRATYVPTELDDVLLPELLSHRYALVVLTGNPGDGKTAFIQQLLLALVPEYSGALPIHHWQQRDAAGWEFEAVLDGSAADEARVMSSDQVIDDLLKPIERAGPEPGTAQRARRTSLLAVNDGRLLEYLDDRRERRPSWIVDQLLGQLGERPAQPHGEVLVVDLNSRSLAHPGEHDVVQRVIQVLLGKDADETWAPCRTCRAAAFCHVQFNVDTLRSAASGDIAGRLRDLVLLVHSRGRLHVTMRELRSALAVALFGDQTCEEIHSELETLDPDLPSRRLSRVYWNRLFAPGEQGGRLLAETAELDPGSDDLPDFDRAALVALAGRDEAESLYHSVAGRSPLTVSDEFGQAHDRHQFTQLRRRAFFEGRRALSTGAPLPEALAMTPLSHSRTWFDVLGRPPQDSIWTSMRDRICRGISLTDDLPESNLETHVAVRTASAASGDLTVVRLFPVGEFRLGWEEPRGNQRRIGFVPTAMILGHGERLDPALEISIDLFELLLRAADGFRLGTEELETVAANLRLFKDRLLALPANEVVLVHPELGSRHVTQRLIDGVRSIWLDGAGT